MAKEKLFRICWAGEGAPQVPFKARGLCEGENPVQNVYRADKSVIPLDWILNGGETAIHPLKGGGVSLVGYLGGPGVTGDIVAEISWQDGAERNVWFEFLWEGLGFGAVLDALEAAGWLVEIC